MKGLQVLTGLQSGLPVGEPELVDGKPPLPAFPGQGRLGAVSQEHGGRLRRRRAVADVSGQRGHVAHLGGTELRRRVGEGGRPLEHEGVDLDPGHLGPGQDREAAVRGGGDPLELRECSDIHDATGGEEVLLDENQQVGPPGQDVGLTPVAGQDGLELAKARGSQVLERFPVHGRPPSGRRHGEVSKKRAADLGAVGRGGPGVAPSGSVNRYLVVAGDGEIPPGCEPTVRR